MSILSNSDVSMTETYVGSLTCSSVGNANLTSSSLLCFTSEEDEGQLLSGNVSQS